MAALDATAEVTLDELRVELAYPLDEASDRFFRQPGQDPTVSAMPARYG